MCIAYIRLSAGDWPVLIAANRDEFHERRAASAKPWQEHPRILAGQDLQAGGTWLGCSPGGRYALLTNYREPGRLPPVGAPSRGFLVRDFLLATGSAASWAAQLAPEIQNFAGFNLIIGDPESNWYLSNRAASGAPQRLAHGHYALSNHLLNTPWPKTKRLAQALSAQDCGAWLADTQGIYAILRDSQPAPASELPDTGLDRATEQFLSSIFITSSDRLDYGTRCSSVVAIAATQEIFFSEQSYNQQGLATRRSDWWLKQNQAHTGKP